MIYATQIGQPAIQPLSSQPTLSVGDIVIGRVTKQVAKEIYHIRFHGKSYSVQSQLSLRTGNYVLLQLQEIGEQLSFKLLDSIPELNAAQLSQSLKPLLSNHDNQFTTAFLRLSLRYHLPVNLEHLRYLKELYRAVLEEGEVSELDFLQPYFFQNRQIASHLLTDRFLLVRWYWGRRRLQEDLARRQESKDAESSPGGAESPFSLLTNTAGAMQSFLSAENVLRWLLRELGARSSPELPREHPEQELVKIINRLTTLSELPESPDWPESARDLLNSALFIGFQLALFRKSLWCCLPVFLQDREPLVFLRRQHLEGIGTRYSFKFEADEIYRYRPVIRGVLQNEQITIHFEHPDQEFRKLVEDSIPLLRQALHRLGLQEIHVHTRQPQKPEGFFEGLVPKSVNSLDKLI